MPRANWYKNPDPVRGERWRYWDGADWTDAYRNRRPLTAIRLLTTGCLTLLALPFVLLALLFGGAFVAAIVTGNPCLFDPPPGDVSGMTLVNDSTAPVQFVRCFSDGCSQYNAGDSLGIVGPGASADWNHEACSRELVGVRDPSGALLGCIDLPVGDPPKVFTWRVSRMKACSHAAP